jgi:hypothetical protein
VVEASEPNEPTKSESADAAQAAPLEHVVDDLESTLSWGEWAVDQLANGRTAEEVAAEMVDNGWDPEEAAETAEQARRATRRLRGVKTREEVAAENTARYHKATALRWFTPILSIASLWRLLNSLVAVWQTRRRRRREDNGAPGAPVISDAAALPTHAKKTDSPPASLEDAEGRQEEHC